MVRWDKATLDRLARALPDIPRWVETRSMLLSGRCEPFGIEEGGEPNFVVRDTEGQPIFIVGRPARGAIEEAIAREWNEDVVIAQPDDGSYVAEALLGWEATRATLHLLVNMSHLPHVPAGAVRMLAPSELDSLEGLPSGLRSQLEIAARRSPIAVSLANGCPVSFCYAAARTEGLWDISIETLTEHRNRGHAARCVAYMVEHMCHQGKMPVWGAEETNPPSLRLAARLGFVPVDSYLVFRPAPS